MREHIKYGLILAVFTAVAGILLGFAHESTKEAIEANSGVSKDMIAVVMPSADRHNDMKIKAEKDDTIQQVIEAFKGDKLEGYLINVKTKGFHGDIQLMVGLTMDGKVSGVKILHHSETPGVGSKVEKDTFTNRFNGKQAENELRGVKTPTSKDNEIETISGASVSSAAVISGVNEAIRHFNENLKVKGGQ